MRQIIILFVAVLPSLHGAEAAWVPTPPRYRAIIFLWFIFYYTVRSDLLREVMDAELKYSFTQSHLTHLKLSGLRVYRTCPWPGIALLFSVRRKWSTGGRAAAQGAACVLLDLDAISGGCTSFSYPIFRDLMIAFNKVVTALCYWYRTRSGYVWSIFYCIVKIIKMHPGPIAVILQINIHLLPVSLLALSAISLIIWLKSGSVGMFPYTYLFAAASIWGITPSPIYTGRPVSYKSLNFLYYP